MSAPSSIPSFSSSTHLRINPPIHPPTRPPIHVPQSVPASSTGGSPTAPAWPCCKSPGLLLSFGMGWVGGFMKEGNVTMKERRRTLFFSSTLTMHPPTHPPTHSPPIQVIIPPSLSSSFFFSLMSRARARASSKEGATCASGRLLDVGGWVGGWVCGWKGKERERERKESRTGVCARPPRCVGRARRGPVPVLMGGWDMGGKWVGRWVG